MSAVILAILIFLVPLTPALGTSDFDLPKWGLLALGLSLAIVLRADRIFRRAEAARQWLVPFGALAAVAALTLVTHGGTAASGRELVRVALPVLVVWFIATAGLGDRWRRLFVLVGAFVPAGVLLIELLLDAGLNPLDIPHAPGSMTSTLGNSAFVGGFAAVSLGFIALLPRLVHGRLLGTLLVLGPLMPTLVLLGRSDARAAWVGAAAFGLVLGATTLWSAGRMRGGMATALLVIVPLVAGGSLVALKAAEPASPTLGRIASIVDPDHPTNRVRFGLWRGAVEMAGDAPLVGVGAGRFSEEFPAWRQPEEWALSGFETVVDHPHNEPLRLLTEYGLVGAALLALAVLSLLFPLRRPAGRPGLEGAHARAALATVAAVAVMALFWDTLRQPAVMLPLAVLVALALPARASAGRTGLVRAVPVFACLAMLAVLLFTALWLRWDMQGISLRDRCEDLKARLIREVASNQFNEVALVELGNVSAEMIAHLDSGPGHIALRQRLLKSLVGLYQARRDMETLLGAVELEPAQAAALREAFSHLPAAERVRTTLELVHRDTPRHLGTMFMLSRLEHLQGRISEAVEWLTRIMDVNDATPGARRALARIRLERAREHADPSLHERAVKELREELALYPAARESDATWEELARTIGSMQDLLEGLRVVDAWIEAMGDTPARRAVAGEMSLHFGETPETVGLFLDAADDEPTRIERGRFVDASTHGAPPEERQADLLAHLGVHPHDVTAIDGLVRALGDRLERARGPSADRLRAMRERAIARSKVLYAWEHIEAGDDATAARLLRVARRKYPDQGDVWFLEIVRQIRGRHFTGALETLVSWQKRGRVEVETLANHPETSDFMRRPEVREALR